MQPPHEESPIFNSAGIGSPGNSLDAGSMPGEGTYFCTGCGAPLALREAESLPLCSDCGGSRFRRASIFEALRRQEAGGSTMEIPLPQPVESPDWLEEARRSLPGAGYHLAFREGEGQIRVFPIERGWTRIGRSRRADVLLDDPSVSRRHAMIVCEPGEPPRLLDDRSLNGILVNGRPVDWGPLGDGDELAIGRFRLYLLHA